VDSGAASCFGAHLGSVLSNLKASGYQPEQVDTILLTHLHPTMSVGSVKMVLPTSQMQRFMYRTMKPTIG
jgi:ribonuclease BN (tRNA processing enzyme)